MNLGKEQKDSDCCLASPAKEKTVIRYPELRINDQIELVEKLSLGQKFQALVTFEVTSIEAHSENAPYSCGEGSSVCLNATDIEIVENKPAKPKGAIALFKEITE